ncbi:MAG: hypothetical protein FK730_00015 [Asgard group archaeon]|nr:hypothetical protein [Asgard group archaeon]
MKNDFILTIVFLIFGTFLFAQNRNDTRPQNNINLNLLGDASIFSVSYERIFFISSNFFLTGKLGLGYNEEFRLCLFGSCPPTEKHLTIPHHITGNLGIERHLFECGIGGTIITGNTNQNYLLYLIVGYRLQPQKPNMVTFRIFGSIPFTGFWTEDILFIPLGLSLGISF